MPAIVRDEMVVTVMLRRAEQCWLQLQLCLCLTLFSVATIASLAPAYPVPGRATMAHTTDGDRRVAMTKTGNPQRPNTLNLDP